MTVLKTLIAAALISTATIPSAFAAWSFADQEPAAFASMYPNRDVLNGAALTPAGRMGLERAGGAAPVFAGSNVHISARHHRAQLLLRGIIWGAAAACGAPSLLFDALPPAA